MSQQENVMAENVNENGLKKTHMSVSTVVFMIFCLVAAGCFGIEEMIPSCGPGLTIIMLCVLPFVWGLPFGLVASELGAVRPQTGGYYKWVQEALGEFWGFQAGWWRTISIYIDNVSYVILAGTYAAGQWDFSTLGEFIFKVAMILIFTWVNIRGMKDIGAVSTILSILVMVAFACVAVCGFTHWGDGTNVSFQITPEPATSVTDWFFYIAGGISVGMWMYSGYESMSTIAGEVENPEVIPKGTLLTIPLIMASYILPTVASLGSLGMWTDWSDTIGYSDVLTTFWGPIWGLIFSVVAILAQCSIFNTYIASGSRGFFALAEDNLAPPILAKVDKKRGVPTITILTISIFALALCMVPFGFIVVLNVSLLTASYIMVYISAMILRRKIPAEEYTFRVPGGNGFLTVICVVPIFVALLAFVINGSDSYLGGMVGLLTGPLMYIIFRRRYGGMTKKDPALYPTNPKTGLAVGDINRMSVMFTIFSIMNIIICIFIPKYEKWGTAEQWEAGEYFDGMLANADVNVMIHIIQIGLYIVTAITIIAAIVTFFLGKKVEKTDKAA